jgi:hypothetical protein
MLLKNNRLRWLNILKYTMKKWVIGLVLALAIAATAVYIFIPAHLKVRKVMVIKANEKGIYPFLHSKEGIARWWPEKITVDTVLPFNGGSYAVAAQLLHGVKINISRGNRSLASEIQVVALGINDMEIAWSTSIAAGANPVSRISAYSDAAAVKEDMEKILLQLKGFLENMENIYGIKVEQTKVKDTLLVTASSITKGMPDNATIYGLVKQLEQYISAGGSTATNAPMLNIFTEDSISYKTMVAIPINRELPETNTFSIKRMVPGNVLVAEVRGGPATIQQSLQQLDVYRGNYNYTAPAKPFLSLVTNRLTEADSSKWITRLYWPVF